MVTCHRFGLAWWRSFRLSPSLWQQLLSQTAQPASMTAVSVFKLTAFFKITFVLLMWGEPTVSLEITVIYSRSQIEVCSQEVGGHRVCWWVTFHLYVHSAGGKSNKSGYRHFGCWLKALCSAWHRHPLGPWRHTKMCPWIYVWLCDTEEMLISAD